MKFRFLLFALLPFFIYCPKRFGTGTQKVEVVYLASLSRDIELDKPVLASVPNMKGIKIGYLFFEQPFMSEFYSRLGFYRMLDDLAIDFLLTNHPVYGQKFLSVKKDLGYGIANYNGVRFAVFSLDRDSLTISEQTRLALVKERSDVLWFIDEKMLEKTAMRVNFVVRNRVVHDTIMSRIDAKPDTQYVRRINEFRSQLNAVLSRKWSLDNKDLADYVLARIAAKKGVNVILYPAHLIKRASGAESLTIAEFMDHVSCELKFSREEATGEEVQKLIRDNGYSAWGKIEGSNSVLLPGPAGEYVFDLLFN
jgi:hypothetical protein